MSLTVFRSRKQGSVIMFQVDAKQLCAHLQWPDHGQKTAHELPAYINQLTRAIAEDQHLNPIDWSDEPQDPEDKERPPIITFAQRATPVLQLMVRCVKANDAISW